MGIFPEVPLFLACPVCTYQSVLPTWFYFAGVRLGIILFVACQAKLDLVRILGLFALFEGGYFFAWRELIWYSHPAVGAGALGNWAVLGLLLFYLGIPVILLLFAASRVPYFKNLEEARISPRSLVLLIPIFFVLSLVQQS